MKNVFLSRKSFVPMISSESRQGFTLIIALLVISSPIVMLINPVLGVASISGNPIPTAPSTIGQDGSDFTTQAALSSLTARPTNNIVNTNSFYDVVFLTASSGAIKTIQVTFPAGTTIPSGAFFNEAEGIGPGTASKSGQTITYTVTNAVNVPVGTKIRLEFANINNPLQVSASYTVTVTTRDAANAIIDGPSQSAAYTMKQIGENVIADGHITSTKPAESFMKRVTVADTPAGHAVGWNPDDMAFTFTIIEADVSGFDTSYVSVFLEEGIIFDVANCMVTEVRAGAFDLVCDGAPNGDSFLNYVVENLPSHTIF